jgi:hypothetical protein
MGLGSGSSDFVPLQGDPGSIGLYVGSFILVCCCWPIWVCLYPLPAAAAVATYLISGAFTHKLTLTAGLGTDVAQMVSSLLYLTSVLVTIVVLYTVSRGEHRLARSPLYRYPRHIVRLPLLGLLAVWSITERNPLLLTNAPPQIRSESAEIFLVAILMWQLLLWKGAPVRRFWHATLRYSGFRPKNIQ